MQMRESSLNKFIVASVLVHLGLIGASSILTKKDSKPISVEISFGSGNSRGGSGPKALTPPPAQAAPKPVVKAAPKMVAPPVERVKTDAPEVAKPTSAPVTTTQTATTASSDITPGSGLGTTSGTGSGTTSGSGAGFNDPKIKYRGQIYQLVNSKKIYPRKARALQQEGTVVAKLILSKTGKLIKVELVEKSSYKSLAEATLSAIKGIKKFPEIPSELGLEEITINIPFEYQIANGDVL